MAHDFPSERHFIFDGGTIVTLLPQLRQNIVGQTIGRAQESAWEEGT
jgi:hypothetical protein